MLLAIDTAGPRLQLALSRPGGAIDRIVEEIGTGHAERIFGSIADLLARNEADYAALTRLAVTTGPGSFTGLRIGISAARGIALARHLPMVGVPSLLAVSLSAPPGAPLVVVIDARRGEAYRQAFAAPGQPEGPAELVPCEAAHEDVPAGVSILDTPYCDIGAVAAWAADRDPADYRPDPAYVRAADAKPQQGKRIVRR